jgi:hypothetical protein
MGYFFQKHVGCKKVETNMKRGKEGAMIPI